MIYRPTPHKLDLLSLMVLTGRWSVTGFWVEFQQRSNAIRRDDYLDYFKQLFGTIDTTNGEFVKELN